MDFEHSQTWVREETEDTSKPDRPATVEDYGRQMSQEIRDLANDRPGLDMDGPLIIGFDDTTGAPIYQP